VGTGVSTGRGGWEAMAPEFGLASGCPNFSCTYASLGVLPKRSIP